MKSVYIPVFRARYSLPKSKEHPKGEPKDLLILAESEQDVMETIESHHGVRCIFSQIEEGPAIIYPISDKAHKRIVESEPPPKTKAKKEPK